MVIAISVNQAIFQKIWDHSSSRHITGYKMPNNNSSQQIHQPWAVSGQVDMNTKIIAITANQAIFIKFDTWRDDKTGANSKDLLGSLHVQVWGD